MEDLSTLNPVTFRFPHLVWGIPLEATFTVDGGGFTSVDADIAELVDHNFVDLARVKDVIDQLTRQDSFDDAHELFSYIVNVLGVSEKDIYIS